MLLLLIKQNMTTKSMVSSQRVYANNYDTIIYTFIFIRRLLCMQ